MLTYRRLKWKMIYRFVTQDEKVAGFEHVYSAMGRPANVADLDLSAAGIELADHGGVKVNEHLQTTAENIYAVGDVAASPAPKLTPVGLDLKGSMSLMC